MNKAANRTVRVLDPAQLVRIEAVHRGFLYQHLYAVQCLLSADALSVLSVDVETDEDVEVEVEVDGKRIYVQVKHRQSLMTNSFVKRPHISPAFPIPATTRKYPVGV